MKLLRPILFFLAVLLSITPTFVHPSFVSKHSSGTSSGLRRSQLAASSAINHLSNTSRLLRLEALRRNDMGFCTDAPVETSIKLINNEKSIDKDSPQCAGIYARSVESVWSARACRYFSRRTSQTLTTRLCGRLIDRIDLAKMCGQATSNTEEDVQLAVSNSTRINPFSRDAPKSFFVWNKAIAAACDASPDSMVDDSRNFPTSDYLKYIGSQGNKAKTFYVVTTQISAFANDLMHKITTPFVLVSGSSDFSAPLLNREDGALRSITPILDNPNLIAWFAQNPDMVHKKLVPIPIGIDFHTLAAIDEEAAKGGKSWGSPATVQEQEAFLMSLRCKLLPFHLRPPHAIMNFKAFGRDVRSHVLNVLTNVPGIKLIQNIGRQDLWKIYGDFSFVISPRGFGKDSHRTWEALALGCAVIVSKDFQLSPLYDDLPVIQIERWEQVTTEALIRWKAELSEKWLSYRWEKLRSAFWIDAIKMAANKGSVESFWKTRAFKNNENGTASGKIVFDLVV